MKMRDVQPPATPPHTGHEVPAATGGRFPQSLMHAAATLYYLKDETQADVARALGLSRATVSRLLSEARRLGIVRIDVMDPAGAPRDYLASRTAAALGLDRVYIAPQSHATVRSTSLAVELSKALLDADLSSGDMLLVSSGRTVWEMGRESLPSLPGVTVTPTVGGQNEPEAWYQTNEITRAFAENIGGRPAFLYAPAQPGADLHDQLMHDPATRRVLASWQQAKAAVLGVGAPPFTRESMPDSVPRDAPWLRTAVGDICTRFFDTSGAQLDVVGSEHLIATTYDDLRAIPHTIALAVGSAKIPSLLAAARAGWFNTLVTDHDTAFTLLEGAGGSS